MNTLPKKTPSKNERLRELFTSAEKELENSRIETEFAAQRYQQEMDLAKDRMERSNTKQKEMRDALRDLLNEPDEVEQEPINLEKKMSEAVVEDGESELLSLPLADPDEKEQVITEASERSALRPSRRDTNSPEEFEPVTRGTTQDVRGRTRPGQIQ